MTITKLDPDLLVLAGYAVGFALGYLILLLHGLIVGDWKEEMPSARNVWMGMKFLWYLAAEILAEAAEEPHEENGSGDEEPPENHEPPTPDGYEAALAALGLGEDFSPEDLKRAYRKAMASAHPDCGGSHEAAQAVNEARQAVRRRHGW